MPSTDTPASGRLPLALLTGICLAFCIWILSLPLFPTQDGPMHLYLAHVLGEVLAHPGGGYGQYYFVRHLLPPYSLYYYALIGLSRFVPILLADKLILCAYIFLFAFGLRSLARAIGPAGDWTALVGTLLLFNWPLGMGFTNFCLANALALWALSYWCRLAAQPSPGVRLAFLSLCVLTLLTHPVPLLAVLGFSFVELLVRLLRRRTLRPLLPDALTLLAASSTLLYLRLFTSTHLADQVRRTGSFWQTERELLHGYLLLHSLTAFAGRSLADIVYRALFYLLLLGAFAVAFRQFRRARSARLWTLADTSTLLATLFLVGFPLIPSDLNGSAYFSARLLLLLWIAALVAASGAPVPRPATRRILTASVLFVTAFTLILAERRIRPIANDIATLEHAPLALQARSVGLLLHQPTYAVPTTLTYDPYFWTGARLFRRTDSVLWNTPWLDLAIIPLGPRAPLNSPSLPPASLESPPHLRQDLAASVVERAQLLPTLDFALLTPGQTTAGQTHASQALPTQGVDPLLQPSDKTWTCTPIAQSSLCTPNPAR